MLPNPVADAHQLWLRRQFEVAADPTFGAWPVAGFEGSNPVLAWRVALASPGLPSNQDCFLKRMPTRCFWPAPSSPRLPSWTHGWCPFWIHFLRSLCGAGARSASGLHLRHRGFLRGRMVGEGLVSRLGAQGLLVYF